MERYVTTSSTWMMRLCMAVILAVIGSASAFAQSYVSEAQSNGFTLKKVVSDTALASGQNFSYTVYYSFPAGATNIVITDVLPPALVFQSISVTSPCGTPAIVSPAVGANGTVTLTWASAPAGCSGSFVITVNFPNGTTCNGTSARNRVCLSGVLGGQKTEFCTGFVLTTAQASNPWNIGKWVASAAWQGGTCPYATGDSAVTYQICVYKNVGTTGQLNLANAVVKDTLPTGAYLQSSSCGATQSGNVITWTIGNLSALPAYNQQCCTFTIVYPPSIFPNGSTVQNQAHLSGTLGSPNQPCGTAALASAQTCVEIKTYTSATLSKWVYTNRQPGCTGQYLVYICNNGTTSIPTFTVLDTLPTSLTTYSVGSTSGGVTATITGGILTITGTGALPVGQCRYVYVNFTIPASATIGSTITNCAYLTLPTAPPSTYKACASFVVAAPAPEPCIWKEVCNKQTSYQPGTTFRYRLRVQNIGGQPINGATITDVLNPNLQYVGNPSYYTTSSWSAPCQSTSNWAGVTLTQSGNTLTFALPSIAASCQTIFYGNCGMYGTGGIPYYFIEFDVKVADTSALGNIPNLFTINGGTLTSATTSNTEYVNVVGTIGFQLNKTVALDTTSWAGTTTATAGGNVNYRLRLTVSPGSVGLRHITFADLLPMDNGAADQLILPPCSPRGSVFNVNFNSTVATIPAATGYNNGSSFAKLNNFSPAGSPGTMFSATCGTLGTWSASIPAASKNLGYYFGATPIGAGNSATAVFKVSVANTAKAAENACNTFAANGAVRHLINSTIISDQQAGQVESPVACITIGVVKPCIERGAIKVECAGKDAAGNQQYTIQFSGVNSNPPSMLALNSPDGTFAPSTFSIPSGAFTVTTTFTDLPPATSIITIHFGILGPNGQVICRDSVRRDLPPCPVTPPESCCEKFIHTFPKTKVSADGFGNVSLVTSMVAGPAPIKRFTATIVSAQRRRVCGNVAGTWERIYGDITVGALTPTPAAGPQLLNIFSRQAEWGPGECVSWMNGAQLGLKMLFPQPYCKPCYDTLRFAIRYSFTDCECRTCDTTIFYSVARKCTLLPWDPTDASPVGTTKADRVQADMPDETSLLMTDKNNGTLYVVNPAGPADESITITGMEVNSADVPLTSIAQNQQNGLILGSSGFLTTSIPPGSTGEIALTFDNAASRMQFPVTVQYTYTIPGDEEAQTSEPIRYVARVFSGQGDIMGADTSAKPDNVRTYAVFYTNANPFGQAIHSIRLNATNNVRILALGLQREGLATTTIGQTVSADGDVATIDLGAGSSNAVEAGQDVRPIYITVSGGDEAAHFEFTSMDDIGSAVSSGTFILDEPVTSVAGVIVNGTPKLGVAVQPNPTASTATVTVTANGTVYDASLGLYNIQGSEVVSLFNGQTLEPGSRVIPANIGDLASGVYYIILRSTNGTVSVPLTVVK